MAFQIRHGVFTEDIVQQVSPQPVPYDGGPVPVIQKGRKYYNSAVGIVEAGQVPSNCNEMTFVNQGSTTVVINQVMRLYPGTIGSVQGDSISFDGKPGEVDITVYELNFEGAGINNCIVWRKNY